MCKKIKRKNLYNNVRLYKNGVISKEQIEQILYSYAVDITTEQIIKQLNNCFTNEEGIYAG